MTILSNFLQQCPPFQDECVGKQCGNKQKFKKRCPFLFYIYLFIYFRVHKTQISSHSSVIHEWHSFQCSMVKFVASFNAHRIDGAENWLVWVIFLAKDDMIPWDKSFWPQSQDSCASWELSNVAHISLEVKGCSSLGMVTAVNQSESDQCCHQLLQWLVVFLLSVTRNWFHWNSVTQQWQRNRSIVKNHLTPHVSHLCLAMNESFFILHLLIHSFSCSWMSSHSSVIHEWHTSEHVMGEEASVSDMMQSLVKWPLIVLLQGGRHRMC